MTKPSASYKNSARLAVAGLLLFVVLYVALAGWFLYTAGRVVIGGAGADLGFFAYVMAACALFIGVLMIKAIFSVKNDQPEDLLEVTASDHPRLFAFLYELADAAGAPRPHKVFLSARVNAAVFYDLSLINLFFPSRKNLEIGLGLVNVLPLGEFRAVLAHEFGHFAQRSMAVGRWVYVAQQIASHMVTRRDKFDAFLVGLGNIDLRIYAFVAVLQLIIWSIRSLVESLFTVVVAMQRALSREMEMQADLVAVSLTGSDALVHALHRMQGADDAWDRAYQFVSAERSAGRATRDMFAVQSHLLQRMGAILNDDAYANVPPLPPQGAQLHRVFKPELAQPPRMWLTHPLNHEREANAKRVYVAAPIDPASAWSVFGEPAALREQLTARILHRGPGAEPATAVELEESLTTLGRQFKREQYHRRYCGVYFGRPLGRHVERHETLRDHTYQPTQADLAALYPATLSADIAHLRALETERGQLRALIAGVLTAPGKVVELRGERFHRKELPAALARLEREIGEVESRLRTHDSRCRSWHQNTARAQGGGWDAYLDGLLALIHYSEHTAANLEDARGLLHNTAAVVTAVSRVTERGVKRVVARANELHFVMQQIYAEAPQVKLDTRVAQRMELDGDWRGMLGSFTLPEAGQHNINDWMGVIDGWAASLDNCLAVLRSAALEELLLAETAVVLRSRQPGSVEQAPAPSAPPPGYATLLAGEERKRQTQLGWWARFQRADGLLPGAARLLVALAIVAAVLGAGTFSEGHGTSIFSPDRALIVYNGLGLPVRVDVDGHQVEVPAASFMPLTLPAFGKHHVETRSVDGRLIESFDAEAKPHGNPVYSVGGATPLVEWTATYGPQAEVPQRVLGAPHWLDSGADHIFTKPPESVSTRGGPTTRTVLEGAARATVGAQLAMIDDERKRQRMASLHARWDLSSRPETVEWIEYALQQLGGAQIVAARLREAPGDVVLRRIEQDSVAAGRRDALCSESRARSDAAPDDGDLKYLALRCGDDGSGSSDAQFRAAAARWPDNPWLINAVAYDKLGTPQWQGALPDLERSLKRLPVLAPQLALEIARIKHYADPKANLDELVASSPRLRRLVTLEQGTGKSDAPERSYVELARGNLAVANSYARGNSWAEAHVLRLSAASDGASADMVRRALALPMDTGLDAAGFWTGLALAMREGADTKSYLAKLAAAPDRSGARAMMAFLVKVRSGRDTSAAERMIARLSPEERGLAYSAAVVLSRGKAPAAWRESARRLLFSSERPYFAASQGAPARTG